MSFLASLALNSLTLFLPQGDPAPATAPQGRAPVLTPAEQATLRDKVAKYLEANEAYEQAEGIRDREKTAKAREKTREQMQKEWDIRQKKGNLLASMADLRAIYDNCFPVPAPKFSVGSLRTEKIKESKLEFSIFLPKSYKADKPMRTVLVLPGTTAPDQTSTWLDGPRHFEAVWDKTTALADTIFHLPHLPEKMEMDPVPDYSRDGQEAQEGARIGAVFGSLGMTMMASNVDRARLFLDCARGNCGFGLRLASVFPDRFAGVVLRQPVAVDEIRIGSLLDVPILMLRTSATAAVVDALKARFEAQAPNSVTVIEATDEYPHKAAAAEIEAWMGKQRRTMSPTHVIVEPNHDRFNKAYWVQMGPMNPLHTAPADSKPRIEVTADRTANRIVVKARGVENFTLLLNDDLVDLDKEFTVIVNDKAVTEKRTRDAIGMQERLVERRDWDYLFPVRYQSAVPKPSGTGDKAAGDSSAPGTGK